MDIGTRVKSAIVQRGLSVTKLSRTIYGSDDVLSNKITGRTAWNERDYSDDRDGWGVIARLVAVIRDRGGVELSFYRREGLRPEDLA